MNVLRNYKELTDLDGKNPPKGTYVMCCRCNTVSPETRQLAFGIEPISCNKCPYYMWTPLPKTGSNTYE